MNVPPELKPACWGAVIGAIALAVIGFSWGGWVTGATADEKPKKLLKLQLSTCWLPFAQSSSSSRRMRR